MAPAFPDAPARPRHLVIAVTITALATALALLGAPPSRAATSATTATVAEMTQYVVDGTNAVRAEKGRVALVRDSRLDKVAADWARQQWENGAMSHNPNYSKQIPSGWQRAGENVAKGYTYTQVVDAWVASSGHYANLVNDYTSVGVGYYEADGRRYWSQVFAKYPGVKPPTETPPSAPPTNASPAVEPAAPAGTPITLSSPSFEDGAGSWSIPSGTIERSTYSRGGYFSLLTSGATGRKITQTITEEITAGSTYRVVVWLGTNGTSKAAIRLRTIGGTSEALTAQVDTSKSGWRSFTVALTTKYDHSGLIVEIFPKTKGRRYRVDSVSLTLVATKATRSASTAPAGTPAPASTPAPAPAPSTTPSPAPAPTPSPTPTPTPTEGSGLVLGILRLGGR